MAWVRPRHPPPKKPKPDPVVTFLPMLSYFSSSRPPPPLSPTKVKHQAIPPAAPLSRDPIIRSFQQAEARHVEEPIFVESDHEEKHRHQQPQRRHRPHHSTRDAEEHYEIPSPRTRSVSHQEEPSPPPPPLPRVHPRPRVASYEPPRPVVTARERHAPRLSAYPTYEERMSQRAVSARWASAATPLDFK
ncbi:MAG: hypothetical protein Q9166_006803 [cf. Caloplaca sp. 2 TL-2023]